MSADFDNSFTVRTRNYFCCNLIAVTYYLPVCYLMTSVWRHSHLFIPVCSFCVEKQRTSFLQTCGLQTVQISIQLTMRSGLWCSVVFTRRKFTPSTNNELKQRLTEVWYGVEQSTVDMATEQWRGRLRACVRTKGGQFEHSLWTYWLCYLVNHLSLLCNCVMLCLNIRSLRKTTLS